MEALVAFFENSGADTGAAYVVVMHLSPTHESRADVILQRATRMPVVVVTKPVPVEQNTVYVISPTQYIEMNDGYLRVRNREPGGPPVAIDQFIRTMALAHGQHAVAVILSGTGIDGVNSLSIVKDQGGLVLVQDPREAAHAGMPRAAVDSGMADFVLPVAHMPKKLADVWRNAVEIDLPVPDTDAGEDDDSESGVTVVNHRDETTLREVLRILHRKSGNDFSKYKRATVLRRIERRMQVREVHKLSRYCDLLRDDVAESQALLGRYVNWRYAIFP